MTEKATARAHPIQGLVKYHGMRDPELRLPYHDSISLCTAPDRDDDHRRVAARRERGRIRHRRRGGRRTRRGTHRYGRRARPRTGRRRRRGPAGKRELLPVEHRLRLVVVRVRGRRARAHRGRWPRPHFTGYLHRRPSRLLLRGPFGDRRVLPLDAGLNDEDCRSHRLDVAWATTASTRKRTSGSSPLTSRLIRRRKRRTARPPRAT